jgi:hypothetical protein
MKKLGIWLALPCILLAGCNDMDLRNIVVANDAKNGAFSINYYPNGATSGSTPIDTSRYNSGDTVTVLDNTGNLAKTGYTFGGWGMSNSGGGLPHYNPGTTFTYGGESIPLTATWIPSNFKFTLTGSDLVITGYVTPPNGSLTIPDAATIIDSGAFQNCTLLTSVAIPTSVHRINQSAFAGCTGLTSFTFPSSITQLGADVLNGCTALAYVYVYATTPPTLPSGSGAFDNCAATLAIHVPSGTVSAYQTATGWSDYASKIVTP